jgi:hypothetical protein
MKALRILEKIKTHEKEIKKLRAKKPPTPKGQEGKRIVSYHQNRIQDLRNELRLLEQPPCSPMKNSTP